MRIKDITETCLEPAVPAIGEDNFRLYVRNMDCNADLENTFGRFTPVDELLSMYTYT